MVVDTSALLAIIFNESHGDWCREVLDNYPGPVFMSSVNLAETLIKIRDRHPKRYDEFRREIDRTPIQIVSPDAADAEVVALARIQFPINLGDCFAYALARRQDLPLMTLDTDFRKTDLRIVSPQRPS